jgi:hypothetical protein
MKQIFLIAFLLSKIIYFESFSFEPNKACILEFHNQILNEKKIEKFFLKYERFKKYSDNSQSLNKKKLEQEIIQFFLTEESYTESQQALDDFFKANVHIKKLNCDILILKKRVEKNYYTFPLDSFIARQFQFLLCQALQNNNKTLSQRELLKIERDVAFKYIKNLSRSIKILEETRDFAKNFIITKLK